MLFAGIMTALSGVFIVAKLSKKTLRRVLGYDVLVDALSFIGLFMLAGTGTYSALMTIVYTGISITGVLFAAKHVVGAERWSRKEGWHETTHGYGFIHWAGVAFGLLTGKFFAKMVADFKQAVEETRSEEKVA